jgi:RimJ/RimL family protein N-acetyltransferase
LDTLAELSAQITVTVVLSSNAPYADATRRNLRSQATLITDASNMAELMTVSDLAIGAPGVTSYERAVLGVPSIIVTLAENQRCIAQMLAAAGAAAHAGMVDAGLIIRLHQWLEALLTDGDTRTRMSRAAAQLVDGRGATRVLLACLDAAMTKDGRTVRLRLADAEDELWLLDLQRQPETRRYARNPAVPSSEQHHNWFAKTLSDLDSVLLIVEVSGTRAGMVRLDRQRDEADARRYEVSIATDAHQYGSGIASSALKLVRALMPATTFDATILSENIRSQNLFRRAEYVPLSPTFFRSVPVFTPSNGNR